MQKQSSADWSCPTAYRMPTSSEYSLVAPCVPAGFVITTRYLGVAWDVSGCGCNWSANWCSQPSIHTFWSSGSTGTACGDYAQLHICVMDVPPNPPPAPLLPPLPPAALWKTPQ